MVVIAGLPASIGFGRFRVLPHRREMIADGKPIKVGGRAFDILMALIEARGAAITKNALMGGYGPTGSSRKTICNPTSWPYGPSWARTAT
jgi:DNA-binding response OmpR family regulator